jgi:hypothetical protein
MAGTTEQQDYVVRVSPRTSLIRNGVLSYALLSLPLFGALYFLGAPRGTWPIALGVHVVTLIGAAACYLVYRRTFIAVTRTEVHERGALGGVTITPLEQVSRVILLSIYRSSSTETSAQLLLCDSSNRRLVRMRGLFWTTAAMNTIASAVRVPFEERIEPVTTQAFFEEYPSSAYWFENRPVLTVLAVIVALAVMLGLVLGLMALMGIPAGNPL